MFESVRYKHTGNASERDYMGLVEERLIHRENDISLKVICLRPDRTAFHKKCQKLPYILHVYKRGLFESVRYKHSGNANESDYMELVEEGLIHRKNDISLYVICLRPHRTAFQKKCQK